MELSEKELSEKNRPKYFKWAFKNKKTELFLTLVGLAGCIGVTPILVGPEIELYGRIGGFIAIYGFTIGITLQPYSIYRTMKKSNYWSPNSVYQK